VDSLEFYPKKYQALKRLTIILPFLLIAFLSVNAQQINFSDLEFVQEEEPTPARKDTDPKQHIVAKGQTLFSIARTYGVTVPELKKANGLTNNLIKIGQKLAVPTSSTTATVAIPPKVEEKPTKPVVGNQGRYEVPVASTNFQQKTVLTEQDVIYIARWGDDIHSIADTYEVTSQQIERWNNKIEFREGDRVVVGKKLVEVAVLDGQMAVAEDPKGRYRSEDQGVSTTTEDRGLNTQTSVPARYETPYTSDWKDVKVEKGAYRSVIDNTITSTRFYLYHKNLPRGTKVRITIPNNAGFIEAEVVGQLASDDEAVAGLSPACVKILMGAGETETVTIIHK